MESYRRLAHQYGLAGLEFLGSRDDVPDLLRGSMANVVPSLWLEAFGNAAAEALACGVPVIASATGGLKEIVDHEGNGLLVPPGDAFALADALSRLNQDADLRQRMGLAGRRKAERLFNLESQKTEIFDILTMPFIKTGPDDLSEAVKRDEDPEPPPIGRSTFLI